MIKRGARVHDRCWVRLFCRELVVSRPGFDECDWWCCYDRRFSGGGVACHEGTLPVVEEPVAKWRHRPNKIKFVLIDSDDRRHYGPQASDRPADLRSRRWLPCRLMILAVRRLKKQHAPRRCEGGLQAHPFGRSWGCSGRGQAPEGGFQAVRRGEGGLAAVGSVRW